ncbi:MAG: hypothetical protein M9963_05100 [Kiritimatiellae bacterium]|nr:hypothetical protein [Kiritimatiellia bacterium]
MPKNKSNLTLAELLNALNRHRKKLPALHKKADALRKKLAAVEAEIAALGGIPSSGAKRRAPAGSRRPRNKTNLGDAIVAVLSKDKPLSIAEIIAAVKMNGYSTTSDNFNTIVYQAIAREKRRIVKASRGLYVLKS